MTDDYNLAKPDPTSFSELGSDDSNPFLKDPQTGLPPYMVDVELPEPGTVAPGEPTLADRIEAKRQQADATGFVPGQDRTKSAPELLEEVKRLSAENDLLKRRDALLDKEIAQLKSRANLLEEANRNLDLLSGQLQKRLSENKWVVNEDTSDGYHTFRELYDHRRALTAALLAMAEHNTDIVVWRSRQHHPLDSPIYKDYFIVGIDLPRGGMVTYHYANQFWDDFQSIPELENAPRWDGAGPAYSVTRLIDYARA